MFNINQFNIHLPHIDDLTKLTKEDVEYLEEDIGVGGRAVPEIVQKLKPDPTHYDVLSTRRMIYLMFREFSALGTSNIVIASASSRNPEATVDGVSEFVADGVVKLESIDVGGGPSRILKVLKMRQTSNMLEFHNFDITSKGITIK
jgi:KaiC/GvpD/RAD55 family RecA-like ATPase